MRFSGWSQCCRTFARSAWRVTISEAKAHDEGEIVACQDVVVTAGAGSGKTRTLVARYVSLLAEGLEPRRVIAITFTKKAAREMRSRVRDALNKLVLDAQSPDEQQMWL